jgi:hypothetical protein
MFIICGLITLLITCQVAVTFNLAISLSISQPPSCNIEKEEEEEEDRPFFN